MKNNSYLKERYDYLKKNHRCTNCGKKDERTLSGKVHCQACSDKEKKFPSTIKRPELLKKMYDEHIAAGLCGRCGAETDGKCKLCEKCREYYRQYNRKRGIKKADK